MKRSFQWAIMLSALCACGLVRAADPVPAPAAPMPAGPQSFGGYWETDDPGSFGLVGGAGIYWMQPYFTNNPAFAVSRTSLTGPGGTARTVTDRSQISQQMEFAPLLWLGYMSDSGFGGRVRFWYFRQGTDQSVATGPAAPGTLTFLASAAPLGFSAFADNDGRPAALAVTSSLQVQNWDAEAMTSVQAGTWDLLLAGGVRFAQINQTYNASVSGDSGQGRSPIAAIVHSGHSFDGVGPVLALEVRRDLGDTGLSLYSSARGAVLFGSARQTASDIFSTAGATFVDDASERRNPVVPVAEVELGLEFSRFIGLSRVVGQIALVGQEWWGIGSASRAANTNVFGVAEPSGGAIVDSDFGFLGLAVRLGVNY